MPDQSPIYPFLSGRNFIKFICKVKQVPWSDDLIKLFTLEKYLDKDLIYSEKKGFSVPMAKWLNGPLKTWAEDIFNSSSFKENHYWDTKKVLESWDKHKKGLSDSSSLIWSVLNFHEWKENSKNI